MATRCAPRHLQLCAAGRRRTDARRPLHFRRPRLSGRRPRAQLLERHGPRELLQRDRQRGPARPLNVGPHEGILPALESSHAIAGPSKRRVQRSRDDVVVCLSGRGDKDAYEVARLLGKEIWIMHFRHPFSPQPSSAPPCPPSTNFCLATSPRPQGLHAVPDRRRSRSRLHRRADPPAGGLRLDLIEMGIPYSDPIADGPVIQAAYTRPWTRRSAGRHLGMLGSHARTDRRRWSRWSAMRSSFATGWSATWPTRRRRRGRGDRARPARQEAGRAGRSLPPRGFQPHSVGHAHHPARPGPAASPPARPASSITSR